MSITCIDCNKNYTATPYDAVYVIDDYPSLGVKAGDTVQKLCLALTQAIPEFHNIGGIVSAEDVAVSEPPAYLLTGFSKWWSKISLSTGWYNVIAQGTDRVVSYDFSDVLAGLGSGITVSSIMVDVSTTENGKTKSYTNTSKAVNAFTIDKALFPVNISMKVIVIATEDNSDIILNKKISVGNLPLEQTPFKFEIQGSGEGLKEYTQKDSNNLVYAKLNTVLNLLQGLDASKYLSNISIMQAQIASMTDQSKQETIFEVGTGINRRRITISEFMAEMFSQMSALKLKIEKFELA